MAEKWFNLKDIYIYKKIIKEHRLSMAKNLLRLYKPGYDPDNLEPPTSIVSTNYFTRTNKSALSSIVDLDIDLWKATKPIFKSIARHLRKLYNEHKSCIRLFFPLFEQGQVCQIAYAYLMWRKDVEGLNGMNQVEKGRRRINFESNPFFDFAYEIQEIVLDNKYGNNFRVFELVKWIFCRVFAFIVLHHFRCWMKVAGNWSQQKLCYLSLPMEQQQYPFFMVETPSGKGEAIKFHWWPQN